MNILEYVIGVIVGCYLTMSFSTFLTLMSEYKYYRKTYLAIKNKEYLLFSNDETYITLRVEDHMKYNKWWIFDDKEILYFHGKGTIKLIKGYIHNNEMLYFDLYTKYWYVKIKKEILKLTRTKAEIRDDKLKQLNIK